MRHRSILQLAGLAWLASVLGTEGARGYIIESCRYIDHWDSQVSLVADLNPGSPDAVSAVFGFTAPDDLMCAHQGALFFQADDLAHGSELWTLVGGVPTLAADIAPGSTGSTPHAFASFDGDLFFAATTPDSGEELFRWNGTSATLAAETVPGPGGAELSGLTSWSGALYFVRRTANASAVWRYANGSASPVAAINQATGGNVPSGSLDGTPFVALGNRLMFVARTTLPERYELWAFDGTSTTRIQGLTPGDDITERSFELVNFKGSLYYGVVAPKPGGASWELLDELWRYTGSGAPVKVATLSTSNAYSFSQPNDFNDFHNRLHFVAHGRLFVLELGVVTDLSAVTPDGPDGLVWFTEAGRLVFSAYPGDGFSAEPHAFDGSSSKLLANIMPDGAEPFPGSFPTRGVEAGGKLYFYAADLAHGRELWQAGGESAGFLDCDIVVAPIFVDKHLWPIEVLDTIVVTWQVTAEGERLVGRQELHVDRRTANRLRPLRFDSRKESFPRSFALVTAVFDAKSGKLLDRGSTVVGTPSARTREAIERRVGGLLQGTSMKAAMAKPVDAY